MSKSKAVYLGKDVGASTGLSKRVKRILRDNAELYLILLVPLCWLVLFKYIPIYGVQIAFRDFQATQGIWGSTWVGLDNFIKFFQNYMFGRVLKNTVLLSFYQLLITFPFPILLALALNNTLHVRYKKAVQMITYMPHFISTVVLVGNPSRSLSYFLPNSSGRAWKTASEWGNTPFLKESMPPSCPTADPPPR